MQGYARYTVRMPEPLATADRHPQPALSLLDTTAIIVGIIIGSGIYQSSPDVAAGAARWISGLSGGGIELPAERAPITEAAAVLIVWLAGGVIALIGAFCYAELATAFPRAGGSYVF